MMYFILIFTNYSPVFVLTFYYSLLYNSFLGLLDIEDKFPNPDSSIFIWQRRKARDLRFQFILA